MQDHECKRVTSYFVCMRVCAHICMSCEACVCVSVRVCVVSVWCPLTWAFGELNVPLRLKMMEYHTLSNTTYFYFWNARFSVVT